jgi:hypothetical protein
MKSCLVVVALTVVMAACVGANRPALPSAVRGLDLLGDCYVVLVRASAEFEGQLGVPYISEDIVLPRLSEDRARVQALLRHGT